MHSRFQFRRSLLITGILVLAIFVYRFSQRNYGCDWTGFGVCQFPKGLEEGYRPEKTLWDWLGLLIVPAVLAWGAIYFNRAERRNELEIAQAERRNELEIAQAERRNELEIAQAERRNELEIAEQRAQDALLQAYLDQMTELLLAEKLRKSQIGDEVRHVAQVRTLIALRRLDRERRTILMQFLRASKLVGLDQEDMIVDFRGVDLNNADLSFIPMFSISLRNASLLGANLEGAILLETDFESAILHKANLTKALLFKANLQLVDLQHATLKEAKLQQANLTDAILFDADLGARTFRVPNLQTLNFEELSWKVLIWSKQIWKVQSY